MSSQMTDNVAVVESFFEDLRAGDLEGCLRCFHPESEIYEPDGLPYAGRYRGPEGVGELVAKLSKFFDFEIHDADIRATGDEAVGILDATFISRKTGERLDTKVVELYRFKDGLIWFADIYPKDTRAIYELAQRG